MQVPELRPDQKWSRAFCIQGGSHDEITPRPIKSYPARRHGIGAGVFHFRIPAMLPHIAFGAHPSGWMIGTTITRDAQGEYRWWHFGPLCFCWA